VPVLPHRVRLSFRDCDQSGIGVKSESEFISVLRLQSKADSPLAEGPPAVEVIIVAQQPSEVPCPAPRDVEETLTEVPGVLEALRAYRARHNRRSSNESAVAETDATGGRCDASSPAAARVSAPDGCDEAGPASGDFPSEAGVSDVVPGEGSPPRLFSSLKNKNPVIRS
jgi:hypothetical protein